MSSIKDLLLVGAGVNGTGTANSVMKWLDADTATDSIIYDNGTNIGIGTSSPVAKLEVSTSSADYRIQLTHTSGQNQIKSVDSNQSTYRNLYYDAATHVYQTSGSERMRIDSSGNVGIGTSNPSQKLDINGGINISSGNYFRYATSLGIIGSGGAITGGTNVQLGIRASNDILFSTGGATERMRIDSSGNVGIGTSSPAPTSGKGLTIADATRANMVINTNGNKTEFFVDGSDMYFDHYPAGNIVFRNSTRTERMRITSSGFLKFTDTGSYNSLSRPENEIQSNQITYRVLQLTATNASFLGNVTQLRANRSSSSSYSYLTGYSLGSADIDFILRGDGIGYSDGGWTTPASDYAEYFETSSGASIDRGVTVVMDGDKVRPATESDDASKIIGIIRPKEDGYTAGIVGGASNQRWNKKYLTDDFGVYLREEHSVIEWTEIIIDEEGKEKEEKHSYESHNIPADVIVPDDAVIKTHDESGNKFDHRKLNPDYDETLEYIPREQRDEWVIVGLLGQVPMLKGQPVNPNWIKMKDISETVELWFIK